MEQRLQFLFRNLAVFAEAIIPKRPKNVFFHFRKSAKKLMPRQMPDGVDPLSIEEVIVRNVRHGFLSGYIIFARRAIVDLSDGFKLSKPMRNIVRIQLHPNHSPRRMLIRDRL